MANESHTRFTEDNSDWSMRIGDTVALSEGGGHYGVVIGRPDVRATVRWLVLYGRKLSRNDREVSIKHFGSFSHCRMVLTEKRYNR
jgi:hypothetical protein